MKDPPGFDWEGPSVSGDVDRRAMLSTMDSLREIAESNEIIRIVNGSKLYGTNVDTSDDDEMAVFVEPFDKIYLSGKLETVNLRDKPEGVRSEAGDTDCVSYSLRHFGHLAMNGNPSVLTLFFAPDEMVLRGTALGRGLLHPTTAAKFASKKAAPRFLGYMQSQKHRLLGEKKGHVPKRPELIEKYGYDVKYANHVVRLGIQGIQFMKSGRLTLPMQDGDVELLLDIRSGRYSFEETLRIIDDVENGLKEAIAASKLPDEPDYAAIALLFKEIHEEFWDASRSWLALQCMNMRLRIDSA